MLSFLVNAKCVTCMTQGSRGYLQVVNKYRRPSTHPRGLAAVPFLKTLLSVNSEKLCVCSPFPRSPNKQGEAIVNHFSVSPEQADCLEFISLWTEVSEMSQLPLPLQEAIRTMRQDENAVVALLIPADCCWTNKLTSKRLLTRARHVVALTLSSPLSSNGHWGEAQIAVVVT